jgi:hypothetical protein
VPSLSAGSPVLEERHELHVDRGADGHRHERPPVVDDVVAVRRSLRVVGEVDVVGVDGLLPGEEPHGVEGELAGFDVRVAGLSCARSSIGESI